MSFDRMMLQLFAVIILLGQTGCTKPNTAPLQTQFDRDATLGELRTAIKTFYDAFYTQNWDVYYNFYSDDVVLIDKTGDVMDLAEYESRAAKDAEVLGDLLTDSVADSLVDVRLSPDGKSGIAYSRLPYLYRNKDGVETTITIAETDVWWKIDGEWKVVHIHFPEVPTTE